MRPDFPSVALLLVPLLLVGGESHAQDPFRDPTRPYSAPEAINAAPARFAVNAIINSDKRRLAIVNGRRVGVGDSIDGAVVQTIGTREVVLLIGDRETTLTLNRGARQ